MIQPKETVQKVSVPSQSATVSVSVEVAQYQSNGLVKQAGKYLLAYASKIGLLITKIKIHPSVIS